MVVNPVCEQRPSPHSTWPVLLCKLGPNFGVPPNVATITIFYQNESKTSITSATISETLNPKLTLVAASATDSLTGVSTTTTEAGGVQTVQFNLVGGIAPRTQGYLEFEVARTA